MIALEGRNAYKKRATKKGNNFNDKIIIPVLTEIGPQSQCFE